MSTHIVTHVYFDGGCPVCRREIDWYRSRPSRTPIDWVDVSTSTCDPSGDLCRADALRVFHVRCAGGRLVRGAQAFALLWQRYPGLALAGRIAAAPGIRHLLDMAYTVFLRVRRSWRRA